jgi:GTPase SAR1 family protein
MGSGGVGKSAITIRFVNRHFEAKVCIVWRVLFFFPFRFSWPQIRTSSAVGIFDPLMVFFDPKYQLVVQFDYPAPKFRISRLSGGLLAIRFKKGCFCTAPRDRFF